MIRPASGATRSASVRARSIISLAARRVNVRKKYPFGRHPPCEQPGDAAAQRGCLARAGPSEDQQRVALVGGGRPLLGVEVCPAMAVLAGFDVGIEHLFAHAMSPFGWDAGPRANRERSAPLARQAQSGSGDVGRLAVFPRSPVDEGDQPLLARGVAAHRVAIDVA